MFKIDCGLYPFSTCEFGPAMLQVLKSYTLRPVGALLDGTDEASNKTVPIFQNG